MADTATGSVHRPGSPAVHLQELTRHVGSVGRGEGKDGSGDVFGRAGPTEERAVDQPLMSLRGHAPAEELGARVGG